jgi:molecular chaperone GrpE
MPNPGRNGPLREAPADSEEIEILEIEGMPEPGGAFASEGVEVPFDEDVKAPPQELAAAEEMREDAASRERLLRLQADFDNLRKRIERDEAEQRRTANARLVTALLPVIDSFERAMATEPGKGDDGTFRAGVELIRRQMLDVLGKEGVRTVESLGKPFDPTMHEAFTVSLAPELPPNTVIEEIQRGYLLNGRLLRPALVRVSVSASEDSVAEDADSGEVS